jgi:hypothetical protein|tara:strand:+ start:1092 stop:1655 length:564 start_codon:yes stop_codon:yes gene_type:complete
MQSPHSFIVQPVKGKRYDNTKNFGEVEFIVSSSQEDHKFSNRYGIVVSLPLNYCGPIEVGDILLVHHNVFKYYYDMKGIQKSGRSYFKDDLFFIDNDQFFLYNKNGEWFAHDKYCFVEPIAAKDYYLNKAVKYEPLMGIMKYPNDELIKHGVKKGDEVAFQPESEYEFRIDDVLMYRVMSQFITVKL